MTTGAVAPAMYTPDVTRSKPNATGLTRVTPSPGSYVGETSHGATGRQVFKLAP
jgi:hypothetical protein